MHNTKAVVENYPIESQKFDEDKKFEKDVKRKLQKLACSRNQKDFFVHLNFV